MPFFVACFSDFFMRISPIFVILAGGLLAGSCTVAPRKLGIPQSHLIRDCPEEKITDKMPTTGKQTAARSYFIYKGQRAEIAAFDTAWLQANCVIKETVVY